jgi:hypothetical protein
MSEVTDQSDPVEVYKMHPEYSDFEYSNFKTNMANLIEKILSEFEKMRTDCEYFVLEDVIMGAGVLLDRPRSRVSRTR